MNDTTDNVANGNGNPTAREQTAAQAFKHHLKRCAAMTDWIEAELEAREEKAGPDTRNWCLVGDLAEMESLLKRALGHLAGMDDSRINEALNELDA